MFSDVIRITIANILVLFCGFFREIVISSIYGTSIIADHFLIGYLLIEEFNSILFVGLVFSIIAYFKNIKDKNDVLKFTMKLLIYTLPISFFTFLLTFFYNDISHILISDKLYDENFSSIVRYSSFSFTLSIGSSIICSFLIFEKKYFIALISKLINYVILILLLIYNPDSNSGIFLGTSISLSYFAQLIFLSFFFLDKKISFKEILKFKIKIYHFLKFIFPWVLAPILMPFLGNGIGRYLISGIDSGFVSSINYASKILNAVNTFTFSVILVGFVDSINSSKNEATMKKTVKIGLMRIIFFTVPITIFCCLHSQEIISILFERGSFDAVSTAKTAKAFYIFSLTLLPRVFWGYMSRIIGANIGNKEFYLMILVQFISYIFFMFFFIKNFDSSVMPIGQLFSYVICSIGICIFFSRKFLSFSIFVNLFQSFAIGFLFLILNSVLSVFTLQIFTELLLSLFLLILLYGSFLFINKERRNAFIN
tara:strand:- start:11262 stop:12707 length:1446 start_codon:yes stop_codon:yes gene_type:complete